MTLRPYQLEILASLRTGWAELVGEVKPPMLAVTGKHGERL